MHSPTTRKSMKNIPISAAKWVADTYGYDQVIIIARRVGEGGGEHVTTYGIDKAHCAIAAHIGKFITDEVMIWKKSDKV